MRRVLMRVFATRSFRRFTRAERIKDERLCEAIDRAQRGLVDADLGRGLIKQRVARPGQGRRSGFRVLIACRHGERAVFLYGFAKSERDNISAGDLATWHTRTQETLSASHNLIERNVADDHLREVQCD
jgi:hypothetical protein